MITLSTHKPCTKCGETKDVSAFGRHINAKNGIRSACRSCERLASREVRAERHRLNPPNPVGAPRGPEFHIPQHRRPTSQARRCFGAARDRASARGLPFTITRAWVENKFSAGVCEGTGLALELGNPGAGSGRGRAFGPSLDRIDPARGYTEDNTQLVCWMYNSAKGVQTHATVLEMARAMVSKYGAAP